jgi:hypothetical protein
VAPGDRYITDATEEYIRWFPLAGIPEAPCGGIELRSSGELQLSLIVRYAGMLDEFQHDLLIEFDAVEIFESYTETADPWQTNQVEIPMLGGEGRWSRYSFPLLEVRNSRYLRSAAVNRVLIGGTGGLRHFCVMSLAAGASILTYSGWNASWVEPERQ